ncbi:hypothetical protein VC83_02848 [Pseudogymnoascus destructans]|uniref:Erythromycin biosynthesis protein CIII-like C-terminal domain-containing protein n=2 Tax=Pseudogymnoascus destructans TaxID=655981 RepID=L8FWV0_PSED2|nr:uncharacterized protein VC83_02848 [Pseudogymnoascus destructans]ELR04963.1 hypothetical protein GMDG_00220 [Pseudogymnoascus destructans 20631-21]OAF59869.1 hypothetical protein VC83_02848 [Pseudogymnoascus destructans]
MTVSKPLILISVSSIYGHVMPIRVIGKELVARGYDVTFVTGSVYKKRIESIGAKLIALEGIADVTEETLKDEREATPAGPARFAFDLENYFVNAIPAQHFAQQKALKILGEQHPGRPIIMLNESGCMGSIPCLLGAPGIKPTATIAIGIFPIALRSIDTASFGPGVLPDTSLKGRARNKIMNKAMEDKILAKPDQRFKEVLAELGVKDSAPFFMDSPYLTGDCFLQMCAPSMEYSRSDAPPTIHFAGGLPKGHRDPLAVFPSWWSDITHDTTKRIVAVSQGTLNLNYTELIIPTMQGLKDRGDVIVVVALGRRGATLPEETFVPENARVVDFIPFDDLLPYCTAFITNGGYGAVQHGISTGVPMIIAGATEDKPEVAARAEWAGVAINLRTGRPTAEQVQLAVEKIFDNGKYKARGLELEEESKCYVAMDIVERTIQDLAAAKH